MGEEKVKLLDKAQTLQKIKRISYEVLENNIKEKKIVLCGIEGQGIIFARLLKKELEKITEAEITVSCLAIDKIKPEKSEISLEPELKNVSGAVLILLDDVLNTGRTFTYALRPLLELKIKKLQTAFVVDRNHKLFPVSADYVGYSLSTTFQDHIEVVLDDTKQAGVYLH